MTTVDAGSQAGRGAAAEVPTAERPDRAVVGSVLRALRLLDCFQRGRPEMSLAELVRSSGYSKTTAYRLLVTLEEAGWLERSPAGAFRLTIKPFQIGSVLVDSLELRQEAAAVMARLAVECDETVYLTVPAGTHAVCLERIDSGQGVRIADLYVGGSQPLHLGAGPRVLLAFREDELLPPLLRAGLETRTPATLATEEVLRQDLAETRRRGFSLSDSDVTPGIAAIGAPVFDRTEQAVAAISIGGLTEHIMPPRAAHVAALLEATATVSRRLGSRREVSGGGEDQPDPAEAASA